MPRSLLGKTLWDRRISILGWVGGTVALGALMIVVYPAVRDSTAFKELLDRFPPMVMAMFGIDPDTFTTGIGYLQAQLYTVVAPLLLIAFSVGMGSAVTAGEEQHGTADLLLAHPVRREQVVLAGFLAMALLAGLIALVLMGTLLAGNVLVDFRLALRGILAINVGVWLLGLFFGAVALVLGAWRGSRAIAAGGAIGLALATFFVQGLAPAVESLRGLAKWLPFHFYQDGNPAKEGLTAGHLVLLVATLSLVGAATLLFRARDIGYVASRPKRERRGLHGGETLLRSVFGKTIWERRITIWFWMLGLCGLAGLTMAFWPVIAVEGLEKVLGMVPKEVFAAFGLSDPATMMTPEGFVTSRVYGSVGLILMLVFAIGTGTALVAGEIRRGSIDLVLSTPIGRRRFLLEGFAAMAALIGLLAAGLFVTVWLGNLILDLDMALRGMIGANLGLAVLALLFGTIALAAGAATGKASAAKGIGAATAIAAFVMNALGAAVSGLGFLRVLSPFSWFLGEKPPLMRGPDPALLAAVALTAALLLVAIHRFERRDPTGLRTVAR